MNTPKIEPCPWCGFQAVTTADPRVMCNNMDCGVRGPRVRGVLGAIRTWNRVARLARAGKAKAKKGKEKR